MIKILAPFQGDKKAQVVLFSSTAIALYGYDQGMMSLINTNKDYRATMGLSSGTKSEAIIGLVVAVYYLGCTVGAVLFSAVGDRFGRKTSIFACLATASIGDWIMFISGLGYRQGALPIMFTGRVVMGLGVGGIDALIPTYSAELTSSDARGKALAQEFQMNIFGLVMAFAVNLGVTVRLGVYNQWAWRIPIVVMQIYPLLLIGFIGALPESPRWFVFQKREEDAREALLLIHDSEDEANKMYDDIKESTEKERESRVTYLDMFTPGNVQFHPTMLTVMCQVNQMLTGYGAVSVYGPQILQLLGFGTRTSEYLTLANYLSYFCLMTIAWLLIDAIGRRKLLIDGSIILSSSFLLLTFFGGLAYSSEELDINVLVPGVIGTVILYVATGAFGIGWLATVWEIPVEIFPTSARAQGAAISVIIWGLANFAVTLLTPVLFTSFKYWIYLIFAATNMIAGISTWLFLPESGNRSFEENQEFFENAKEAGTWQVHKVRDGEFTKMIWRSEDGDIDAERVPLLHRVGEQLPG